MSNIKKILLAVLCPLLLLPVTGFAHMNADGTQTDSSRTEEQSGPVIKEGFPKAIVYVLPAESPNGGTLVVVSVLSRTLSSKLENELNLKFCMRIHSRVVWMLAERITN